MAKVSSVSKPIPKKLIENRESIRGTIKRLYAQKQGWCAGVIDTGNGDIPFSGKIVVSMNQPAVLHGEWVTHPKYGTQFNVQIVEIDTKMSVHGLANYLSNNPIFKGIGDARAWAIAEEFADNFEEVLLNEPKKIADVAKCKLEIVEKLATEWKNSRHINVLMTELSAYELTYNQASKLVEKLGDSALGILKSNPYKLMKQVDGFAFKRIDVIALRSGMQKSDLNRINAGILYVLNDELDNGNTCIPYDELLDKANKLLILDCLNSKDIISNAIDLMTDELKIYSNDYGTFVGLTEIYNIEQFISNKIKTVETRDITAFTRDFINAPLNDEQYGAVEAVYHNPISIITGGAGVGKTFTLKAILQVADSLEKTYALAAPTGKAAKRIQESTGKTAYTIHRLLGWTGQTRITEIETSINDDLLIIDEASMVDSELFYAVVKNIDFNRTRLVLVGDHNQLPPVGYGSILKDLIDSKLIPVCHLKQVHRQAGILKQNSVAILDGKVAPSSQAENDAKHGDWYVFNRMHTLDDVRDCITEIIQQRIPDPLDFDLLRDVQILTPTHKSEAGTAVLNSLCQQEIQKKLYNRHVDLSSTPRPVHGDKIIITKNMYDLGLVNGEMGLLRIDEDGKRFFDSFDAGDTVPLDEVEPNIYKLAYALTVHKAQGSEFPCVIFVCHKNHSFIHHRNLFYTAVTRAKKIAIVVGDDWGIRSCASKISATKRMTFLSFLLESGGLA